MYMYISKSAIFPERRNYSKLLLRRGTPSRTIEGATVRLQKTYVIFQTVHTYIYIYIYVFDINYIYTYILDNVSFITSYLYI